MLLREQKWEVYIENMYQCVDLIPLLSPFVFKASVTFTNKWTVYMLTVL